MQFLDSDKFYYHALSRMIRMKEKDDVNNESRTRSIGVTGMTCATCAETISKSVKELEGVEEANVNLASEKATFTYDPSLIDISKIEKAIRDAGYGVASNEVTVKVKGMKCAACVTGVEASLERMDGIISAAANLATESIRVRYDPGVVGLPDIKRAISDAGYEPLEAMDMDSERAERDVQAKEHASLRPGFRHSHPDLQHAVRNDRCLPRSWKRGSATSPFPSLHPCPGSSWITVLHWDVQGLPKPQR